QLKKKILNETRRIINKDKIRQLNYKSISTLSNTKSNSQYDKDKQKSKKEKKDNNPKVKLAGGILGSFLICSFAYLIILFKNKNEEDDIETSETAEEFENGNPLSYLNMDEEVIEVSFFRDESL
ncbi:reticulocyte binding protein, putative, partial [Plasmodium gallinaceum]